MNPLYLKNAEISELCLKDDDCTAPYDKRIVIKLVG